jgi:hypothetical protein
MHNCWCFESYITFKAPTTVRTNVHTHHSKDKPEDGSVFEPKHVARTTTNTSNKLRVVYDFIPPEGIPTLT